MNLIENITLKGLKDFSMFLTPKGELVYFIGDEDGYDLLESACDAGNLDLVKFCVEHEKDVMEGSNGLRLSIERGSTEIVRYLLSQGFDIKDYYKGDPTAIHIACMQGELEIVKLLVEYGCDLSLKNDDRLTPLEVAKKYQREEVVNYLE